MPNMTLAMSIINFLKDEAEKESNPLTKENFKVAVQCVKSAYNIDPTSPELAQYVLPNSLEDIFASALPPAHSEEEVDEKGATKEPMNEAKTMKNSGNNMGSNHFTKALECFTACIEIDGSNPVYYCDRAATYHELNDFQSAIKDCQKAVEIDPNHAIAYDRMGLAYTCLEQNDLAIKAFKQALEIEPNNEIYQCHLKTAMEKKDKPNNPAEEVDEKGATKEPMNKAKTMKNLGNDMLSNHYFTKALGQFTACIELDGSNPDYYCYRAATYNKLNDFQSAIKDCQKAVEIDPNHATAYGRMGLAYTFLGQNDLAVKAFKQALEIEPNNEIYQCHLKTAMEKKDKPNNTAMPKLTLAMSIIIFLRDEAKKASNQLTKETFRGKILKTYMSINFCSFQC